jgi:hypothetical protein
MEEARRGSMRHGKLISGLVLGLVVAVTALSFAAYRAVKRAFSNAPSATQLAQGPPATSTPANKELTSTQGDSLPVVIENEAMAQAFRSGRLPAPLPQPTDIPELAAMQLAKRVMAEDEQSTAALLTAVQMSGFSVRADDGTLAYESVKPGQGIWIDAWEVAALAKLFGEGMQVKLSDLSDAFAGAMPQLKNAPVAKLLVDGVRGAAQGNQPALRFWADFIIELGRQSPQPYDLLAPDVDPTKVDLDAIQVSLILRRLAVELMIQEGNKDQKGQSTPDRERDSTSSRWEPASFDLENGTRPYIRDAVWHPELGPRLVLAAEAGSNLPCTLEEYVNQILDVNAYLSGKVFEAILEYLEEHAGMEGAGKYGKATSKANAVLALIKLIAYYACMETDIKMEGDAPLKRTPDMNKNGERRTLVGSVRENIGNWQAVNCTRIALNGANLDISLPNDGPVKDVEVQWYLAKGGTSLSGHDITWAIVGLISPDGTNHVQDAIGPYSNATAPKTNEEGEITIGIEGLKQREQLFNPSPIMKEAQVNFSVPAKAVSMRQDIIDAVGVGTGIPMREGGKPGIGLGGKAPIAGPLSLAVGGLVETLLRSKIHLSKTLTIPVRDWISCDGSWGGTISYTTAAHSVQTIHGSFDVQVNSRDETMEDEITLRGDPNGRSGWGGSSHGSFTASYGLRATGVVVNRVAAITTDEMTGAAGNGETTVELTAAGNNKYEIHIMPAPLEGTHHWHTGCTGLCKGTNPPDMNNPIQYSVLGASATAKEDPNNPGVLHGSEPRENTPSPGTTTTISWNLNQCQGGK